MLEKIEESLRRGEDEISKAAGRLKWLNCQCRTCAPLILKCGECRGCISGSGSHTCGVLSTASGRFAPAARAFIFRAIAHDGSNEMEGITAWKRHQEQEKLAHRELGKLQTADRKHQLKMAQLAAFDDNESLAKEAKQQALDMSQAENGRLPEGFKSVYDQENTTVQQVQIRKEQLPYDVCPRCGFGIGWMKCRFHEGQAYMWCKAGRKIVPGKRASRSSRQPRRCLLPQSASVALLTWMP